MWVTGVEPAQALSYSLLRAARLTTPAHPHEKTIIILLIKVLKKDLQALKYKKELDNACLEKFISFFFDKIKKELQNLSYF
jgi:hypothetical protein